MEEKTGRKLEFDIKIVFLNEMVDTTEIGNTLFPIKEKIVLKGKLKYHKKFIKKLERMKLKMIKKLLKEKIRNGELYKIGGNEDDK
jgi:hypothetical protein